MDQPHPSIRSNGANKEKLPLVLYRLCWHINIKLYTEQMVESVEASSTHSVPGRTSVRGVVNDMTVYNSYNKSQQVALFLNFILIYNSICFGQTYCLPSGVLILYSTFLTMSTT